MARAVLWRPLPFERPEELAMVFVTAPAMVSGSFVFFAAVDPMVALRQE